jgi:hypothetical protein
MAKTNDTTANLGFEAKLWLTADKLRNNMDAAEYKHVVLGLIFLKYISDTFEDHHAKLVAGKMISGTGNLCLNYCTASKIFPVNCRPGPESAPPFR